MKEIGTVNNNIFATKENAIDFGEIFNSVFRIKLNEQVLNQLEYLKDQYKMFLEKYQNIENQETFNEVIRLNEVLYLHSMEMNAEEQKKLSSIFEKNIKKNDSISFISNIIINEDELHNIKSFKLKTNEENANSLNNKIENYSLNKIKNFKSNSIKFITAPGCKGKDLCEYDIKNLHNILFKGISLRNSNKEFRKKDTFFVGYNIDENKKHVDYFPPLQQDINRSINEILTYINDPGVEEYNQDYALFINPLIAHGLITILQPFNDGNSRVGRVINSAMILKHTNSIYNTNLRYPLLYVSRNMYPFRENYREYIKNIAVNPSDETWNKWILFGLRSIEEYINYSDDILSENNLYEPKVKTYR